MSKSSKVNLAVFVIVITTFGVLYVGYNYMQSKDNQEPIAMHALYKLELNSLIKESEAHGAVTFLQMGIIAPNTDGLSYTTPIHVLDTSKMVAGNKLYQSQESYALTQTIELVRTYADDYREKTLFSPTQDNVITVAMPLGVEPKYQTESTIVLQVPLNQNWESINID